MYALVAVAPTESVTLIVKLYVPSAEGVPLITPVLVFRLKLVGKEPESIENVLVPVPPLADTVSL